jgi:drug/metabolite transporter (DMT)-like permease
MRETPFAVLAGLAAYVVPNIITFSVIPHIGSGLASLTFALSPVMTALLSLLLGVRPPRTQLLLGVGLGFSGAVLIALARDGLNLGAAARTGCSSPSSSPCRWRAATSIERRKWPVGMSPLRMAAAATVMFLALMQLQRSCWPCAVRLRMRLLTEMPGLSALQVATSLAQFLFFFRLQWIGGPTYLSQIGYVAAAVGLASGFGGMLARVTRHLSGQGQGPLRLEWWSRTGADLAADR